MANVYSDQITNQRATPQVLNPPSDEKGRVRVLHCTFTAAAAAADVINAWKLPAGRVRILGRASDMYGALTAANFDVGWAAYTESDGDAVDADADGLDDGVAVDTALTIGSVLTAASQSKVFDSKGGVTITITPADAMAIGDTFAGSLLYVQD